MGYIQPPVAVITELSFPEVKRSERESHHSLPTSSELHLHILIWKVKTEWTIHLTCYVTFEVKDITINFCPCREWNDSSVVQPLSLVIILNTLSEIKLWHWQTPDISPSLPDTEFCYRKYFMTSRAFRARRQDWTAHAILQKYALAANDQTSPLSVGVWNSKVPVTDKVNSFLRLFLFVPHCKQNAILRCLCIHLYQEHKMLSNQLTSSNSNADQIPRLSSDVKGKGTTEYLHNASDCK